MHRSRLRPHDVPRLALRGLLEVARLFSGAYSRTEGAHVLVADGDGRILVVRTTYLGPGWMLPGGRVERGETPHRAAVRETREETGLEVQVTRLLMVDAHKPHDVSFVFAAEPLGGELRAEAGEIAEAGFMDRDTIAATAPRLHRLLTMLDEAGEGVRYLGL